VRRRRIGYRISQFFYTVGASFKPVDTGYAAARLSPELFRLFRTMHPAEQHHGIEVCAALELRGEDNPALLTAALLHDVGKSLMPPRLWERVAVVLVGYFAPRLAARWGREAPQGLRRGFVIRHRHAQWGAELVAEAGARSNTVRWIRRHHQPPGDDERLAALQAADEAPPGGNMRG
jgi:putative nucleotidyltransferase with HDIG domain